MSAAQDDMMELLTPEERAAIAEADDEGADGASGSSAQADAPAAAGQATGAGDEGDDDDGDPDAAPVEGAAAAPAPAPAGAPAAAPTAAPAAAPATSPAVAAPAANTPPTGPTPAPAPRYDAQLPADYNDKLGALKTRDADLRQKFKAGEIELEAFDAGMADIQAEREGLLVMRTKAEISEELNAQSAQQEWVSTINAFVSDTAKSGGVDYRIDAAKMGDLDTFVKLLGSRAENDDKPMVWFLQEAHRRVQALHGLAAGHAPAAAPAAAPATPQAAVDAALARRKPPIDAAPVTLAQVPGGDGPGDVAGEFADIDALEGLDLEDAIGRMSPAQRDRYMRGR